MASPIASSVCLRCGFRGSFYRQLQAQLRRGLYASPKNLTGRTTSAAVNLRPKARAPLNPSTSSTPDRPDPTATTTSISPSVTKRIAQGLRNKAPSFTETYVAYGICEQLVKECVRVADYTIPQAKDLNVEIPKNDKGEDVGVADSWWYTKLGLTPTFNTWAQITFLHMYLITVRLRGFEHAQTWHQHLTDHFFQLAEDRMILLHRLNSRMIRNKYLKDLYVQWRGLNAAYDEGIIRGDAILASAVWRNIYKGDDKVDFERLAEIVCYIRSVLANFDVLPDEVLAQGDVVFGDPSSEEGVVKQLSTMANGVSKPEFSKAPAKIAVKK